MKSRFIFILLAIILLHSCGGENTKSRNTAENALYHYNNIVAILEKNVNSTVNGVNAVKEYVEKNKEELTGIAQAVVEEKDPELVTEIITSFTKIYSKIGVLQKKNSVLLTHPDVLKAFALIDPAK